MAESKDEKQGDGGQGQTTPNPSPQTGAEERGLRLELERLKTENARLTAQIEAGKKREDERKAAVQKGRDEKEAAKAVVPISLVHGIGDGRRPFAPDDSLSEKEIVGLTEGVHYKLARI